MHADLILEWIKYQALIITPLIPHFSEHIWQHILDQKTSVQNERYPEVDEVDTPLLDALQYIRQSVKTMRDAELALAKRKKGGKGPAQPGAFDPLAKKGLKVYTAKSYPQWQEQGVEIAKECWNENEKKFDDAKVKNILIERNLIKDKKMMPFIQLFKRRILQFGSEIAFNRALPFNEAQVLSECSSYFLKTLGLEKFDVDEVEGENSSENYDVPDMVKRLIDTAEPGSPGFQYYNV